LEAWTFVSINNGLAAPEMAVPLKYHWKLSGVPVAVAQKTAFAPVFTVSGAGWVTIEGATAGVGVVMGGRVGVGVGAGLTVTDPETPLIEVITVSVAVTVCGPALSNVTWNVPTPFVSVPLAGSTAVPPVLPK
jgi:hypothetical protein